MSSSGEHTNKLSMSRKRELQGPRPSPLKLQTDSHKIKKPLIQAPARRPPVVIYLSSPKVVHVEARDFMKIVQELTGKRSSSLPSLSKASLTNTSTCGSSREVCGVGVGDFVLSGDNDQRKEDDTANGTDSMLLGHYQVFPFADFDFCSFPDVFSFSRDTHI